MLAIPGATIRALVLARSQEECTSTFGPRLTEEVEMAQIVGGCRCGQVRYSANAEPAFTGVCHCTSCQKESGTAFNVVVAVPQAALTIEGSPKSYAATGDSGRPNVSK